MAEEIPATKERRIIGMVAPKSNRVARKTLAAARMLRKKCRDRPA